MDVSEGVTPSERYLAKLCKKSFLTLWSYPNLFRNQGRVGGKGDGKELCDLLVVCGDDVIIFSDKSCAYPSTGTDDVDWGRWFRRSVRDSAKQVFGAERWLKTFPHEIFMDRGCTKKLPISIPCGANVRYHRIVVALGAKDRCKARLNGNGSLMLLSDIKGEADHKLPFVLGQVAPDKGYVHVFDNVTLDVAMGHLDTVTDFVHYLTRKEALLLSRSVGAGGEEDLIAFFLHNADSTGAGRHFFDVPADGHLVVNEGYWNNIHSHPNFQAKLLADKPSYLWDSIIEEFTHHLLGGTLREGLKDAHMIEPALRCMATETRFARRVYANCLLEIRAMTGPRQENKRVVQSMILPATAYVFLIADWDGNDLERYRRIRQQDLEGYCLVFGNANRQYKRIIGIATENVSQHGISHDLIYADFSSWTPEMEELAKELQKERGWLKPEKTMRTNYVDHEYPPVVESNPVLKSIRMARGKVGRNEPCPCGSGRKYKKCCL